MKPAEVHKMNDEEIHGEVQRLRRQLFDLRCQAVTEKLENPKQLNLLRKDIARLLTVQRARQLQTAKN